MTSTNFIAADNTASLPMSDESEPDLELEEDSAEESSFSEEEYDASVASEEELDVDIEDEDDDDGDALNIDSESESMDVVSSVIDIDDEDASDFSAVSEDEQKTSKIAISKMTARQRGKYLNQSQELLSLEEPKKVVSNEDRALKRKAERKKAEHRLEQAKLATVEKLLNKKSSKKRGRTASQAIEEVDSNTASEPVYNFSTRVVDSQKNTEKTLIITENDKLYAYLEPTKAVKKEKGLLSKKVCEVCRQRPRAYSHPKSGQTLCSEISCYKKSKV